ncbi:GIY-YIG nuclease family protein [Tardibacter chloracetimidivorans]|uniref:GIY-YIG nuclease family protein n=1 Tax=Tardibacter chloracetimidivorans TaxID=1921510 RepID=UPI001D03751F|nr:GIY-YIG nuclease family protein [Tardibacter chloracetimidivorans]
MGDKPVISVLSVITALRAERELPCTLRRFSDGATGTRPAAGWREAHVFGGVYALSDPDGRVRYIGSATDIGRRFVTHLKCRDNAKVGSGTQARKRWMFALLGAGHQPRLWLLERIDDPGAMRIAESRWIAEAQAVGEADLNIRA